MPLDGTNYNSGKGGGGEEQHKLFLSFEPFSVIQFDSKLETYFNEVILRHYEQAKKILHKDEIFPEVFNRGRFNGPTTRVYMSSPEARIQKLRNIRDPLHWQFSQIAMYCPEVDSQLEKELTIKADWFLVLRFRITLNFTH